MELMAFLSRQWVSSKCYGRRSPV
ncbi:hypothetical protein CBM2605_A10040 [Cupriavidus neocaledonicus]|uniref:Transposase n=1 Tax=Cupriavidus neocaledonicus TaxID=1040979 RepID=A0ABY1UVE4_9BURK|nr:hypothetical protein CBM2605_A10040 [Cupriavidus neocaledonicus]